MSALPGPLPSSFSVAVYTKRRACVLDTYLALSPLGLLLAQRLSTEFDLWLVRELWQILDNTQFYLAQPERLLAVAPEGGAAWPAAPVDAEALRDTLSQWEAARTAHDLTGLRIYWIGDALDESLLPPDADPQVVSRFEMLASSLDARVRVRARDLERDSLVSLIGKTGAGELLWTGLNLAGLHGVAPRAIVMPSGGRPADELYGALPTPEEPEAEPLDWWRNARSFWYPLDAS